MTGSEPAVESRYGTWRSPLSAALMSGHTKAFAQVEVDGSDVLWLEQRPTEDRAVIVRRSADGTMVDVTPPGVSVGSTAHEGTSRSFVANDGVVWYVDHDDQRLYRQDAVGAEPRAITPDGPWKFADPVIDLSRGRLIALLEDVSAGPGVETTLQVVAIPLDGGVPEALTSGRDFYGAPRVDQAGDRLTWLEWDHPGQSFEGTELWVADLAEDGSLQRPRVIAGGPEESILSPVWSPDGILHAVSDRTGFWNVIRIGDEGVEPLTDREAEFLESTSERNGDAFTFLDPDRMVTIVTEHGVSRLALLDLRDGALRVLDTGMTFVVQPHALDRHRVVFIGGSWRRPIGVFQHDLETGATIELAAASATELDERYLSEAQLFPFPTSDGQTAFAHLYPPRNPDHKAPAGERPPLLVYVHGGPIDRDPIALGLGYISIVNAAFWTSRGFAVLAVDYRGSTGHGRAYRHAGYGGHAVLDVQDCIDAARHAVATGVCDPDRLAIRGTSAGGTIVLCALTRSDHPFKAGVDYFGISSFPRIFEAIGHRKSLKHYGDLLFGTSGADLEVLSQRSMLDRAGDIRTPLLILQGSEDLAVPVDQSRIIVDALRRNGTPFAYVEFEGEPHGFFRAENIRRALETELAFYGLVFELEPADDVPPIELERGDDDLSPAAQARLEGTHAP